MNSHPLKEFYNKIYKQYDLVNRIFTFGMDRRWRRIAAGKCLDNAPVEILDLCCGTGDLAIEISMQATDRINITGYDFNDNMLDVARIKTKKKYISNIQYISGNVRNMPFKDNYFDAAGITFGFRNLTYQNPDAKMHIDEIFRVLKPDASLIILESARPDNKLVTFFYNIYLKVFLIPVGGILSGNYRAYKYLAKSSGEFYNIKQIENMLMSSGFRDISVRKFLFGATNLISVRK